MPTLPPLVIRMISVALVRNFKSGVVAADGTIKALLSLPKYKPLVPMILTDPLTSNCTPGANVPTPTLPLTNNPLAGAAVLAYVVVPIAAPPTIDNIFDVVHVP